MATSEIFPIFQRTKRPTRPTTATASVQHAPVRRAAKPGAARVVQARGAAGAIGGSRPGSAARTSQPSGAVPRPRTSNTAARGASPAAIASSSQRTGSSDRNRGERVSAVAQTPLALKARIKPMAEVAAARQGSSNLSSKRSAPAERIERASRSVDVRRTENQARSTGPARAEQGDRPARRFFFRVGLALLVAAIGVFALAFLGVLPARTYFGQQDELVQKKARLVMLGERNSMLGNRVASLQSDQVVARIARDQFGMVAPGDTLTVLPGLRDESLSLNGDASNIVPPVPPADVAGDPALLSSLLRWIRQIVG